MKTQTTMNSATIARGAKVAHWSEWFDAFTNRIGKRFTRAEARQHAALYLRGLLSPVQRKNGWQLSESAGAATPYAIQHLLRRAVWDADAVREDLRDYVIEHLGDPGSVLVVGETGFIKKGDHSVGVQRQFNAASGRVENCQIGLFLAYSSQYGRAFIDRELNVPQEWLSDPERCKRAGIPENYTCQSKTELVRRMVERAHDNAVPFSWVSAEDAHGNDPQLREWLEQRNQSYVLGITADQSVSLPRIQQTPVEAAAAQLPSNAWQTFGNGDDPKAGRQYAWARIELLSVQTPQQRWLLVRKNLKKPEDTSYYVVFAPHGTTLADLAYIVGQRRVIEEGFESAKNLVGLDQYEVRNWVGWYRHITLALLAHAYLAVLKAQSIDVDLKADPPRLVDITQPHILQVVQDNSR